MLTIHFLTLEAFCIYIHVVCNSWNFWKYWKSLEFLHPGNTSSLLEFNWSLWKFLADGMTRHPVIKDKLQSSCLKVGNDDYVYFS